jgi:hypothetical protein
MYQASDVLVKHRECLEQHIYSSVRSLFDLEETVTLYDLTNTYVEGEVAGTEQAKRGRSKEKRSDCPLVMLGTVSSQTVFAY